MTDDEEIEIYGFIDRNAKVMANWRKCVKRRRTENIHPKE